MRYAGAQHPHVVQMEGLPPSAQRTFRRYARFIF